MQLIIAWILVEPMAAAYTTFPSACHCQSYYEDGESTFVYVCVFVSRLVFVSMSVSVSLCVFAFVDVCPQVA